MEDEEIVGRCFQHMQAQLSTTKPRGVLLNGSIELFLKEGLINSATIRDNAVPLPG